MSTLSNFHKLASRENLEQLLAEAESKLAQAPAQAAEPARRAEHLARRKGNNRAWAQSLFIWGVSQLYSGSIHEALGLFSRALAVYRFLGDEEGQWASLKAIGLAWGYLGDPTQAHDCHAQANAFPRQAEFAA
ncbi:hypothetical protein [Meiothermus rufus]|uniref:hypothetical protein n=1 Tax=Meiothermus rufus TaxID=604332 RepID=UPI00048853F3|nr:hypothetical protein [Meiothermus rufus]